MANEVHIRVTATDAGASTTLRSVRTSAAGVATAALAMGTAVVGATTAAGAAVLKLATSYSSAGAAVYDLSKRTGFSTVALSELKHAADLSGTSIEGLEVGIRRMQNVVVDASNGVKGAKDSLGALGLSVEQLKGQKPEELFDLLLQRLASMEDDTLKAALATDLFGKSGTQLLPILADGSEGLAEMRKQARELGVVFSEEDAAAADEFDDAMLSLNRAINGVKFAIGKELLPVLTPMVADFKEWIATNGDEFARDVAEAIRGAAEQAENLFSALNAIRNAGPIKIIMNLPSDSKLFLAGAAAAAAAGQWHIAAALVAVAGVGAVMTQDINGRQGIDARNESLGIPRVQRVVAGGEGSNIPLPLPGSLPNIMDPEDMRAVSEASELAAQSVSRAAAAIGTTSGGGFGGGGYGLTSAANDLADAANRAAEEAAREAKELEEQFADMWQRIRIHEHEGAMARVHEAEETARKLVEVEKKAAEDRLAALIGFVGGRGRGGGGGHLASEHMLDSGAVIVTTDSSKLGTHRGDGVPYISIADAQAIGIPGYAHGGVIEDTGLAYMHKGETVIPAGQGGPTVQVTINGDIYGELDFERKVVRTIRDAINGGGFRDLSLGSA